ncbi:Riboflavin transporter [Roseovarius albus]|uniref:Riboflavin transporter n=1 Tax=Roseovarius albus TaxID=1247867 RepID=A0A1X6YQU4_9RHOB|nr:DMT family transporter [Roseovarius albus]SLN28499.1 Riboflavin transporter [Roseovarius albus]
MSERPAHNPAMAACLTLAASAFAAGTTLLAKALGTGVLGPEMHALQISHGRFLFALIAIGISVLVLRPKFTRPNLKLHIGRSALGWGGVTFMFAAAAFIPLSDATAISFLNPVFGMMLAIPFLGEKVGKWRWFAAIVALVGAAILTRPGAGSIQAGALLALGSALLLGAELILIKLLAGREKPLQVLLVNNLIGLCIATVAVLFVWQMPTPAQWAALIGIGVLMAMAQACFVNAMARADASFVAPFFYAALVFAALYDAVIFRVIPDWVSVFGAMTILTGAALLAWREGVARTRKEV